MTGGLCRAVKQSAFCVSGRAQDQAQMQLSEMEEEMDQRIHAAERKTREQVGGKLAAPPRDNAEGLVLNNPATFFPR